MKKIALITGVLLALSFSVGCSQTDAADTSNPQTEAGSNTPREGAGAGSNIVVNDTQIIGLVTEVAGNEITIEIGQMERGASMGSGMGASAPEGGTGERPATTEGGTGEMPATTEGGTGERPATAEGGTGERPATAEGGTGERPAMAEGGTGERPSMSTEGGMGAMTSMSGEDVDLSESITLTGETETFMVPIGTPVTQMGVEMTFSQLAVDTYIQVTKNEEGNIVSINVLG